MLSWLAIKYILAAILDTWVILEERLIPAQVSSCLVLLLASAEQECRCDVSIF